MSVISSCDSLGQTV